MALGTMAPVPIQQFLDENGDPYVGGTLTTYLAGSSTKSPIYSDALLQIPLPNPITLDAAGRCPTLFLGAETYKFVLKNVNDVVVWTADNVASNIVTNQVSVATFADRAGTADTALHADDATNAQHANTATSATTAETATNAGHATTAENATNATNAVNAQNATNATNAQNATNATTATNATNATTATNATNAATATNANALGGQPPGAYALLSGASFIGPVNFSTNTPVSFVGWREVGHDANIGEWVDVPWAAANFTSNVGAWNVSAGQMQTFSCMRLGHTIWVECVVVSSTTSGSPGELRIPIPLPAGQNTCRRISVQPILLGFPTQELGYAVCGQGNTIIQIQRLNQAVFPASVSVYISIKISLF